MSLTAMPGVRPEVGGHFNFILNPGAGELPNLGSHRRANRAAAKILLAVAGTFPLD